MQGPEGLPEGGRGRAGGLPRREPAGGGGGAPTACPICKATKHRLATRPKAPLFPGAVRLTASQGMSLSPLGAPDAPQGERAVGGCLYPGLE